MLGLIVSEFVQMVEVHHGARVAEAVLFESDTPMLPVDADAYPRGALTVLVRMLAARTGVAPAEIMRRYRAGLLARIRMVHPDLHARHADLFARLDRGGDDVRLADFEADAGERDELDQILGSRERVAELVAGLEVEAAALAAPVAAMAPGRIRAASPASQRTR